jgi:Ankyrin repeats (3 copies)/SH2 domain
MHYIIRGNYTEELIEVLDLCIARGGDLEWRNKYGESLLTVAALRPGAAENVRFLLDHGSEVNARDSFGVTALHKAVEAGAAVNVMLLLKHGADVTAVAEKIGTPMDAASKQGDDVILNLLKRASELEEGKAFEHEDSTYGAYQGGNSTGLNRPVSTLFTRRDEGTFEQKPPMDDNDSAGDARVVAERETLTRKHSGAITRDGDASAGDSAGDAGSGDLWYFPGISRQEAEVMISAQPEKSFLVRDSSVEGCYALSLGDPKSWSHLLIVAVMQNITQWDEAQQCEVITEVRFTGYQIDPSQNIGLSVDCSLYPTVAELINTTPELKSYTAMGKLLAGKTEGDVAPKPALSFGKMPSMSELSMPSVAGAPGFQIEEPSPSATSITELWDKDKMRNALMFEPYHYQYFVYRSDHFVYMGTVNQRGVKDKFEPIGIIICPFTNIENIECLRLIVDTRFGDVQDIMVPDQSLQDRMAKKGFWGKQKTLPAIVQAHTEGMIRNKFGRQQDVVLLSVAQVAADQKVCFLVTPPIFVHVSSHPPVLFLKASRRTAPVRNEGSAPQESFQHRASAFIAWPD